MPDHKDAELILKLYDMRREPVMRESRDMMWQQFQPKTYEEFKAITENFGDRVNQAYRQTTSYWEMVFAMGQKGLVDPEYLVEFNGEGVILYCMVQPFIEQYRKDNNPWAFQYAEWAATQTEKGREYVEFFKGRMAKMMEEQAANA